ncbi:MAG: SPFH domain-containing protein [Candidatus Omnitrophota bacterium]|jgi:regulator of protease activity HflC (stomatin/prohibitin superfamily)
MRQGYEKPQNSGLEISSANFSRGLNNPFKYLRPALWPAFLFIFIILKCFVYVRPNEFGIKQVNIGFKTGIQATIYETGLHFLMPMGMEVMHRFPRDMQVLELTNFPESASRGVRREKAAHIQTSDGFFVDVDITMLYRVADPYKVITTIGPGRLFEDNAIIPKAESKLKEDLGEMTTEEFYNSPLREKKSRHALELLNEELNPKGIVVGHILVRYFVYSAEIQRNIEEKKLKDQMVFTNQSKAKASMEEALLKKARQEGEANIKVTLEQGKAYVMKKNAEKDLYVRSKIAEADLLVNLAEAQKTELINLAYQNSGSDKLVGLKMAEVYKGIEVIMLPSSGQYGMNPLDLEGSLRIFGVGQGKEQP